MYLDQRVFHTPSVGNYLRITVSAYESNSDECNVLSVVGALLGWLLLGPVVGLGTGYDVGQYVCPDEDDLVGYYEHTWWADEGWGGGDYVEVVAQDLRLGFSIEVSGSPSPKVPGPNGLLVKGSCDEIWVVVDGVRHWIPDVETFMAGGYSPDGVQTMSDDDVDRIPLGNPIPSIKTGRYPDNLLVKSTSSDKIYVVQNNARHWIPDVETFLAKGYCQHNILEVSDAELHNIPEGAPLARIKVPGSPSPKAPGPKGSLVKGSCDEIWVVVDGVRHWIPDVETFMAGGYSPDKVQTMSDNDVDRIPLGNPIPSVKTGRYPDNLLVKSTSSDRIYAVQNKVRHWIPDAETFAAKGYCWHNILEVSDAELHNIPEGAPLARVSHQ